MSASERGDALHGTICDGRYRLLELLGRGGGGCVYRAREETTGREVALKLVHSARTNARRRERLLREGRASAALRHPGIVRIHDCGEHQGIPFLVYELVPGGRNLADAFAQWDRPARVALVLGVAEALAHAHAQGILHRDIKPENVLLDPSGRARLTDFGLALDPDSQRLTRTGELVGTPNTMAPEQFAASRAPPSPRTDVWALGVLLYEALCGRPPFRGETLVELVTAVAQQDPLPPRRLDRTVPRALERLCLRALAKDPARRPPDAGAFAAELAAAQSAVHRGARGRALRWGIASLIAAAAGLSLGAVALKASPGSRAGASAAQTTQPPADKEARAGDAGGAAQGRKGEPAASATPRPDPARSLAHALQRGDTQAALACLEELDLDRVSSTASGDLRARVSERASMLWRWVVDGGRGSPSEAELLLRLLSLQRRLDPSAALADARKDALLARVRPDAFAATRRLPPASVLSALADLYPEDDEVQASAYMLLNLLGGKVDGREAKRRVAEYTVRVGERLVPESLRKGPDVAKTQIDLLILLERYQKALRLCERARRHYPRDPDFILRSGRCLRRLAADAPRAERVALLRRALALHEEGDGQHLDLICQRSLLRWDLAAALSDPTEALRLRDAAFGELFAALPFLPLRRGRLPIGLGSLWPFARALGRLPKLLPALTRLEKGWKKDPELAAWGPRVAIARYEDGDAEGAAASLKDALETLRAAQLHRDWLGPLRRAWVRLRLGDAQPLRNFLSEVERSGRWPSGRPLPKGPSLRRPRSP